MCTGEFNEQGLSRKVDTPPPEDSGGSWIDTKKSVCIKIIFFFLRMGDWEAQFKAQFPCDFSFKYPFLKEILKFDFRTTLFL